MPFDIDLIRARTPGCANVAHFNNAGAALPSQAVTGAVIDHVRLESEIGGYEAAAVADDALENFYLATAALLNAKPAQIAFIENATRAWDMAFYAFDWRQGDRILTSVAEYASNFIAFLQVARKYGVSVDVVPNDSSGALDPDALSGMIDDNVRLIAVTHVPTNGGLVNPVAAIGRIANAHGIPYLLDACQSVGQMPLDVQEIGCDMLSATGRKYLRGPRGTGFLWVRDTLMESLEPPFLDLHAAKWVAPDRYEMRPDARRFENWECNIAGKIGLGVAIDEALELGLDEIYSRVQTLAGALRDALSSVPAVTLRDIGREQCGIVTFTMDGVDPTAIKSHLAADHINVSVSGQSSTFLDMESRGLDSVVRASVHYYNTQAEIIRLRDQLAALEKIVINRNHQR
ncbi:MAG: aminotransferase class V-fold PLP-dependent enzyme [Rhodospirillaceae bacterium]|nr:aminotransferase class V-fold PLP-dependent enzyme [Rhodospirillaceae bacterium]MBT5811106.1 aminotransferase class V-fold PLP-dependent enzyme [Rhodospirillaceae bacterium]